LEKLWYVSSVSLREEPDEEKRQPVMADQMNLLHAHYHIAEERRI